MKKFGIYIFVGLTAISGCSVNAEQMVCPPGYSCAISAEEKIRNSYENAILVLKGEVSLEGEDPEYEPLDGNLYVIKNMRFHVEEVVKGNIEESTFDFWPTAIRPSDSRSQVSTWDYKDIEDSFYDLERSYERDEIDKNEYTEELGSLTEHLLDLVNQSEGSVFAVPVKAGGLDSFYREVTVPLTIGQVYYLFVFKDYDKGVLFPWDIDLYPANRYKDLVSSHGP